MLRAVAVAIPVAVAVFAVAAALDEAHFGVVVHAADDLGTGVVQILQPAQNTADGRGVLPHDHDDGVGIPRQDRRICDLAAGGGVDDDIIKFLFGGFYDLLHFLRGKQLRRINRCRAAQKQIEVVFFGIPDRVGKLAAAGDDLGKPCRITCGETERLCNGGLAQVAVNEQHLLAVFGKCERNVDRRGGLALVFERAGDNDRFLPFAQDDIVELGPDHLKRFDKGEAAARVRDQNAAFFASFNLNGHMR